MSEGSSQLLIKRYASRRLYNTETSDYVTLEDIARFIRDGREVQIIDLKSGDDLTRQYLLQIIAEHESKGDNVLPTNVLTDLVRSYTSQANSVVPEFLAMSFDMLREGPTQMVENMEKMNPLSAMPGYDAMQAQQKAFMKAVTGGFGNWPVGTVPGSDGAQPEAEAEEPEPQGDDLNDIKSQLAELQAKLAKMAK